MAVFDPDDKNIIIQSSKFTEVLLLAMATVFVALGIWFDTAK